MLNRLGLVIQARQKISRFRFVTVSTCMPGNRACSRPSMHGWLQNLFPAEPEAACCAKMISFTSSGAHDCMNSAGCKYPILQHDFGHAVDDGMDCWSL